MRSSTHLRLVDYRDILAAEEQRAAEARARFEHLADTYARGKRRGLAAGALFIAVLIVATIWSFWSMS